MDQSDEDIKYKEEIKEKEKPKYKIDDKFKISQRFSEVCNVSIIFKSLSGSFVRIMFECSCSCFVFKKEQNNNSGGEILNVAESEKRQGLDRTDVRNVLTRGSFCLPRYMRNFQRGAKKKYKCLFKTYKCICSEYARCRRARAGCTRRA